MGTKSEQFSFLKVLVAQWRLIAKMALAHARDLSRVEMFDPQRAAFKAEMLEVWLRFILFTLVAQLGAMIAETDDPDDPDLLYLHKIAVCLAMTLVLVGHLKRKCLRRPGFLCAVEARLSGGAPALRMETCRVRTSLRIANNYFDSS